jgi:uncharacterized protein YciI
MELERYTIALLVARRDPPRLGEADAAAMQDAHMSHLADLHEAGHLLAAGPLRDDELRGLSILNVDPERARELKEADPAVRAGLYTVRTAPWLVPPGLVAFSPGRVPRSVAEVRGT